MYKFNAEKELEKLIENIGQYKEDTVCAGVVLGLSGGTDSTFVAMLCKKVFKDNFCAVLMPNGVQKDIGDSLEIANTLNINYKTINIEPTYNAILANFSKDISEIAKFNIPPRIRMVNLYLLATTLNYRVVGTGNLSESYIGWTTKFGDNASDFNPLAKFTKTEVIEMGKILAKEFNLPLKFITKPPADGLTMRTDEENFGFSYAMLDRYIRTGKCEDENVLSQIEKMNKASEHKRQMPFTFK